MPDGLADVNPIHALGSCGGLAFEVPAGQVRTLVIAIGVYLDSIVTTGLEGKYYYTRFYSGLEDVLGAKCCWIGSRGVAAKSEMNWMRNYCSRGYRQISSF